MGDDSGYTKKETDWLGNEKEVHYDADGNKVGETRFTEEWLGQSRQEHFDTSGNKVGETRAGTDWLGNDRGEHSDADGDRVGYSRNETDWLGQPVERHYDSAGHVQGESRRGSDWLGTSRKEHEGRYFKADASRSESSDEPAIGSGDYDSGPGAASTGQDAAGSGGWVAGLVVIVVLIAFALNLPERRRETPARLVPKEQVISDEQRTFRLQGVFSNGREQGESVQVDGTGNPFVAYDVELWTDSSAGLVGMLNYPVLEADSPAGALEEVKYDASTGRCEFRARTWMGETSPGENVHQVHHFIGVLRGDTLEGGIERSGEIDAWRQEEKIVLRRAKGNPPNYLEFRNREEWERRYLEPILKFRGPKPSTVGTRQGSR